MTNEEKKVIELALEALERSVATCFDQRSHDEVMGRPEHFVNQTITAIKQALAQPDQEPVAWVVYSSAENDIVWADKGKRLKQNTPLYTAPPQRKPLTDEQKVALCKKFPDHLTFNAIKAIEAAHGIKE